MANIHLMNIMKNIAQKFVGDEVDVIVMGFDTELTFKKLEDVSKLLLTRELPYIATNPDYVCPMPQGACKHKLNTGKRRA